MKKLIIVLIALTLSILACQSQSTPPATGIETMVAQTLVAMTSVAPAVTEASSAPQGISFSYQNVSITIPNGLADGATGETVPTVAATDNSPWWAAAPENLHITLSNYDNSLAKFTESSIWVYPVQGYDTAADNIQKLQAIIASPTAPLTKDGMPKWIVNAGSQFTAQMQRIDFASGSGVRTLTQYGQAPGPASNNGVFYHFQGLTSDGKYYIVAILPTGAPFLAYDENATPPQPADGIPFTYESMDPSQYEAYYKAVEDKLDATNADAFTPSLNALDALIQSITIQ